MDGPLLSGDDEMTKRCSDSDFREFLSYDPETGGFVRLKSAGGRYGQLGMKVGTINAEGYVGLVLKGRHVLGHRLAWFLMTETWPDGEIDHINGVRNDNRWVNLRCVSKSVNLQNQRRAPSSNRTGLLGVKFHRDGTFQARIKVDGHSRHLGTFGSAPEAHEAYLQAKRVLHEGCTI